MLSAAGTGIFNEVSAGVRIAHQESRFLRILDEPADIGETFVVPEPVVAALVAAVKDAIDYRDHARPALRKAVCDAVDALKEAGVPPERALLEVRAIMTTVPTISRYPDVGKSFITWCLERYYGGRATPRQSK
jgi:hypothetical protein